MSHFENIVTDGNERADELARSGAMLDEGFMAEARAKTMQQERKEVYAALQYAASSHFGGRWQDCEELKPKTKEKWNFVDEKREETKHPRYLSENFGRWRKRYFGGHDMVRRVDRRGEILIWCRKCSVYARQRMRPELMNCCRPEQVSTKEHGKMLKRIQILEDGRVPAREAKKSKVEGQKRRITRKECQRLLNKFEMEGFMAEKGLWNLAKNKALQDRGALPREEGDAVREYKARQLVDVRLEK